MALDPTISLKAGGDTVAYDPIGSMNKAYTLRKLMTDVQYQPQVIQQQLATAKAAEQSSQAATSGQQLLNEQAAREAAAKKRLAEIAKTNTKVVNGKVVLDHISIANQASSEGLDPQTVFTYMEKAAGNAQQNIKTADDENKFVQGVLASSNNMLRTQTDPARAAAMAQSTMGILTKAVGPEKAKAYAGQYWQVPDAPPVGPDGKPDIAAVGNHFITQSKVNQQATISPQQDITNRQTQEQIAISAENTAQAGALGAVSATDRADTTSPKARALQDLAIKAGVPELQARGMTVSALQNLKPVQDLLASNVTPAATRAGAATKATDLATDADFYDRAAAAADKIKKRFPELTPANIIANKINQAILSDPDANEYYTLIRQMQEKGVPLATYASRESFSQVAKGKAKELRTQAGTQGKLATSPTLNAVPGTPSNPAAPAAPSIPSIPPEIKVGTIKKFPDGTTRVFNGNVAPGDDWRKKKYWSEK